MSAGRLSGVKSPFLATELTAQESRPGQTRTPVLSPVFSKRESVSSDSRPLLWDPRSRGLPGSLALNSQRSRWALGEQGTRQSQWNLQDPPPWVRDLRFHPHGSPPRLGQLSAWGCAGCYLTACGFLNDSRVFLHNSSNERFLCQALAGVLLGLLIPLILGKAPPPFQRREDEAQRCCGNPR